MRKLLLFALLIFTAYATYAQTVSSRDNHTGSWGRRASWLQHWQGITTTNPLPVATINQYGYLYHGMMNATADMTLSGAGSLLTIQDTLRIHGNLTVAQSSELVIETNGVLIVHGNYLQHEWSKLTIKGSMIVHGDLKLEGNTQRSENSGRLYVGGNATTAGWSLNPKPLSALSTDDPVSWYFAHTNITSNHCTGTNSGTLTYTGAGAVLRWESSTDYFKSDIQAINSTATQYTYTNLTRTTSYRVYYRNTGAFGYSNGATIIIDKPSSGGEISGPSEVCGATTTSATFSLNNHYGGVVRWEWSSSSNFAAGTVQASITTEESLSLNTFTEFTYIRAVLKNGSCAETYSAVHLFRAHPGSEGGSISGPLAVCGTSDSGTLSVSNHRGNILRWETSNDNFVSDVRTIESTQAEISFTGITGTSWFRTVVQSGSCAPAYSQPHQVALQELQGGSLSGPTSVCSDTNSGLLILEGYRGSIVRWEWSNDGFASHSQSITHTQDSYSFADLTSDRWFRVVVGNAGCEEKVSTIHKVSLEAASQGGELSGISSVCKGTNSGTLSISGQLGTILGWEYSGDNFASEVVALAHTGSSYAFSNLTADRWYRVVVQNGSCAPVTSASFKISVSELAGGSLSGPAVLCQDSEGQLSLSDHIGEILRWESSTDDFASAPQPLAVTSPTYAFSSLSTTTWFRVVLGNPDCGQTYSTSWKIEVNQPSLAGMLSGPQSLCTPEHSGTLRLQDHRGAILRWERSTDNFASPAQSIAHTGDSYEFSDLSVTTWYRAVVQNGSCDPVYTQPFEVSVTPASQGGSLAGATTMCAGDNSGSLSLENSLGQVVRWESSTDDFATYTSLQHSGNELSYQDLSTTTSYRAVVQNGSCAEAYSQPATITVLPPASGGRVAADAIVRRRDNTGTLQLLEHSGEIIRWESSADNFAADLQLIENTTDTHTYQNILQTRWFRAVIANGSCAPVYSLSAKIRVNEAPIARNDTLQVAVAEYRASVSVLQNDSDPEGDALLVQALEQTTAAGGMARLDAAGMLYYLPPANYLGLDSLRYTVCDQVGEASLCAEALIVLEVRLPAAQVVVYQGVSPNGDGKNDFWMIEHIERYPNNSVQLYDRYGTLVYEARGYNNQDTCFSGQANRGIRPGGNQLPDGTYFYKIVTAPAAPVLKGYIVLKN
jgi:gliding motility-associated-like protein